MTEEEWAAVQSAYRDILDVIEVAGERGHDVEAWMLFIIESRHLAESARSAMGVPHGLH